MAEYPPAADRPGTSGPAGDGDVPAASDPAASDPVARDPAASDPAASDTASDPVARDPAASDTASDPVARDPAASDTASDPVARDPAASDTASDPVARDRTANQDSDRTDEPVADRTERIGTERIGDSTDDAFLALVARFDDEPTDHGWPAAENVGGPRRSFSVTTRPDLRRLPPVPRDDGEVTGEVVDAATEPGSPCRDEALDDLDNLDDAAVLDDEDGDDDQHFEPQPAPPAPRMKPVTRLALSSIALGLAILFVPTFAGYRGSSTQDLAGVLLILGGVGTLVAKMGDRPPTDSDGPDDGAVV